MDTIVNARDAKEIINKIKYCEKIVILDRDKNIDFLSKYQYSRNEAIEIIKNLRVKDFKYKYKNRDFRIDADYLYVFRQDWRVLRYDGFCDLDDLFIKVCYLNKNNKIIVGVSFHNNEF